MKINTKFILFIICLVALLLFQSKVVVPTLYKVASSDLFLESADNFVDPNSESVDMIGLAFIHCNTYIAEELDPDISATFASKPINTWSLGANQYVINADVELTPADSQAYTRRYACQIEYTEGNDINGVADFENWSVSGINGIED